MGLSSVSAGVRVGLGGEPPSLQLGQLTLPVPVHRLQSVPEGELPLEESVRNVRDQKYLQGGAQESRQLLSNRARTPS